MSSLSDWDHSQARARHSRTADELLVESRTQVSLAVDKPQVSLAYNALRVRLVHLYMYTPSRPFIMYVSLCMYRSCQASVLEERLQRLEAERAAEGAALKSRVEFAEASGSTCI